MSSLERRFNRVLRLYLVDYIAVLILAALFLALQFKSPNYRQFRLDDVSIQHEFAKHEHVPNAWCIFISQVVPAAIILVTIYTNERKVSVHLLQLSILGLSLSFALNGFVTDMLKLWIGRPRPDFLARCVPATGTPTNAYLDVDVCTADLSSNLMRESMKSAPSGHSSDSFAGLLYLTLWLGGQFGAFRKGVPAAKGLLCLIPLLVAAYIAISRIQDSRHHTTDVISGSILGSIIAWGSYRRYFPRLSSIRSNEPESATPEQDFDRYEDESVV